MVKVYTKNGDLYNVDLTNHTITTPNGGFIRADEEVTRLFLLGARYLNYPVLDIDTEAVSKLLPEIPDIFSRYKVLSETGSQVFKTIPTKYGLAVFVFDKVEDGYNLVFSVNFEHYNRTLQELIEMILEGKITLQKITQEV